VALAIGLLAGAAGDEEHLAPDTLRGRWVTSDPDHQDRYIRIGARTLGFGVGGILEDINAIERIERQRSPRRRHTRYRFHYLDAEGDSGEFVVDFHEKAVVPSLRSPNAAPIWWRDPERS
jgi:hypothetical protein